MAFDPIDDPRVRASVRFLFLGAAAVFLITILLGIANAAMQDLPRGQILAHFHSGTIGLVTLSVIAVAFWAIFGKREVSDGLARGLQAVAMVGIVAVVGYVFAFYTAFDEAGNVGDRGWLLPLFGIPAAAVIWTATSLVGAGLKRVPLLTTPHVLLFAALLTASLGALMGVVLGMAHSGLLDAASFPTDEPVGAHAGPMDMYLALAFAAVVEGLILPARAATRSGIAQAVIGATSGFVASIGWFLGYPDIAAPVGLLLFLVAFGFYMVRVGWRPIAKWDMTRPGLSLGALFFPVYVLMFVGIVGAYYSKGGDPPHVLEVAFVHLTFIGVTTNLVFSMMGRFSEGLSRGAAVGMWAMNIGLVAFVAGELAAEVKHGAWLMALGVLMAWGSIVMPLVKGDEPAASA